MSNELSKKLFCVLMRSGVQIWVEQERAQNLQNALDAISSHKFVRFEEQTFNTADLEGVYSASTMQELTRRKNGEWQCQRGTWHQKKDECHCKSPEQIELIRKNREEYFAQYGAYPL